MSSWFWRLWKFRYGGMFQNIRNSGVPVNCGKCSGNLCCCKFATRPHHSTKICIHGLRHVTPTKSQANFVRLYRSALTERQGTSVKILSAHPLGSFVLIMRPMQKRRGACGLGNIPERSTPEFRVTARIARISGIPVLRPADLP